MTNTERRRDHRVPLERRVKLMCPITGRCYGGQTRDFAAGGVCVELDGRGQLAPGTRVRIGIDWTGRQGLLRAESMPQASIVRSAAFDGRSHLGLAFEQRQELAASA